VPAPAPLRLCVDLGGTNTRITDGTTDPRAYRNDAYPAFEAILAEDLKRYGAPPAEIHISAAGPETYEGPPAPGEAAGVQLTNRSWRLERAALASQFSAGAVYLYNDLYAAAHGVLALADTDPSAFRAVCGGAFTGAAPFVVVGLGTGVGCAAVLASGEVVASEAGHMPAAADAPVLAGLQAAGLGDPYPSYEALISGGGLERLMAACGAGHIPRPADVPGAARAGDGAARSVLAAFHVLLGRLLTAVTVAFRAEGGVCLVSDILRAWGPAFAPSELEAHYLTDAPGALRGAPVALLERENAPLTGLLRLADRTGEGA